MNTFLNIFFKTNDTFEYLDNQFEDKLETNNNLIFMLFGAIAGINSLFKDYRHFDDIPVIIFGLIVILVGAGLGLTLGRYLLTYTLYGLGKLVKGQSNLIDIRVVVAYSFFPTLLKLPITLFFGFTGAIVETGNVIYWILIAFYLVIWLWSLKIMIQGVVKFQEIGIFRAIVNISPFLIIGLLSFLFVLG